MNRLRWFFGGASPSAMVAWRLFDRLLLCEDRTASQRLSLVEGQRGRLERFLLRGLEFIFFLSHAPQRPYRPPVTQVRRPSNELRKVKRHRQSLRTRSSGGSSARSPAEPANVTCTLRSRQPEVQQAKEHRITSIPSRGMACQGQPPGRLTPASPSSKAEALQQPRY